MLLLKALLGFVILLLLPLLVGERWLLLLDLKRDWLYSIAFCYVSGTITLWALFQLVAVPFVFADARFTTMLIVYCLLATVLLVAAMLLQRKAFTFMPFKEKRKGALYALTGLRKELPAAEIIFRALLLLGIIVLFALQLYHYLYLHYVDDDDARFIVTALEAYEHNQMLHVNQATGEAISVVTADEAKDMCSPWMLYIAVLAKLVRVHPAILAHGIYAVILLGVSLLTFFLLGDALFPDEVWKRNLFLYISMLGMTFMGEVYPMGAFALTRIWQGKASMAAIGIPFMLFCFLLLWKEGAGEKARTAFFFTTALAFCLFSGMGVIFSGVLAGAYVVSLLLAKRDLRQAVKLPLLCLPALVYGLLYTTIR